MRQQSLRRAANRYLKMDHRGSFRDKQHRAFVIHHLINTLFLVGDVPASWRGLRAMHLQKLVGHWQQQKIKPATIMGYMTVIRRFLNSIDCPIAGIDNFSMGLTRQYKLHQHPSIQANCWQRLEEPTARLIMALQTQFGLTFSEAIRCRPNLHCRERSLWITREIAFNSMDRIIPVRNAIQQAIITDLTVHTTGANSLMQQHGADTIRYQWRHALAAYHLPTNKSFRYLYAQQLKTDLSPSLDPYKLSWLIRDEMGVASRNTLWLYLRE